MDSADVLLDILDPVEVILRHELCIRGSFRYNGHANRSWAPSWAF